MSQEAKSVLDTLAHAQRVAANGLIDRRVFLRRGVAASLALAGGWSASAGAGTIGEQAHPWQKTIGAALSPRSEPSPFMESQLKRDVMQGYGAIAPGSGSSMTPLHALHGTLTPSYLHFERHHNGVPQIDPAQHTLTLHGLVERPLVFDMDALMRYPMVSRICFIECSGNSFFNTMPEARPLTCGAIHGLVSCTEWTGFPLALLLQEAGIDPRAKWILAEGADSAAMSRSIPLDKALDDVLVAFWQNGEPLRPAHGFPVRLVIPGFEGNMSVKWLHRLKLTTAPTQTKDETSKYTDLLADGRAEQFTFTMGAKSVITRPSGGMKLSGRGFREISGLAWSGAGKIRKVEVSADGGRTWGEAFLHGPVLDKSMTRFSMAWQWDGGPAQLQSRATDEHGRVQLARGDWLQKYAPGQRYHNNSIQTWSVNSNGEIGNVFL